MTDGRTTGNIAGSWNFGFGQARRVLRHVDYDDADRWSNENWFLALTVAVRHDRRSRSSYGELDQARTFACRRRRCPSNSR
ncbi:MAG: hypothetical protein MZW92_63510 [Comamonadaceae bacterium]|nr:hypothetical protein [Comamonadaceae bacterium]